MASRALPAADGPVSPPSRADFSPSGAHTPPGALRQGPAFSSGPWRPTRARPAPSPPGRLPRGGRESPPGSSPLRARLRRGGTAMRSRSPKVPSRPGSRRAGGSPRPSAPLADRATPAPGAPSLLGTPGLPGALPAAPLSPPAPPGSPPAPPAPPAPRAPSRPYLTRRLLPAHLRPPPPRRRRPALRGDPRRLRPLRAPGGARRRRRPRGAAGPAGRCSAPLPPGAGPSLPSPSPVCPGLPASGRPPRLGESRAEGPPAGSPSGGKGLDGHPAPGAASGSPRRAGERARRGCAGTGGCGGPWRAPPCLSRAGGDAARGARECYLIEGKLGPFAFPQRVGTSPGLEGTAILGHGGGDIRTWQP